MNLATIIRDAQSDGVALRLSPAGDTIKATGDPKAVNRWAPVIREHKAEVIKLFQEEGQAAAGARSRWWRLTFEDGRTVQVACSPPATRTELLQRHTGAVEAEPFTPAIRAPEREMTPDEEQAIRRWCQAIGETDPEVIASVLQECKRDADTRRLFLGQAAEVAETLTVVGLDDWLDAIEHFTERAGIAEFDGRLTRAEAEALAWQSLLERRAAGLH